MQMKNFYFKKVRLRLNLLPFVWMWFSAHVAIMQPTQWTFCVR